MFQVHFVSVLGLCCLIKESYLSFIGRPLLVAPTEAMLNSVVIVHCELPVYPKNESVLFQLFKTGDRSKLLGEFSSLNGEAAEIAMVIRWHHDGSLECVAKAQNNSTFQQTVSNTHRLRVIEPVKSATVHVLSGPTEFLEGQSLKLSCSITAGSYVSYKWLLNGQLLPLSSLPDHPDHLHNVMDAFRTSRNNSGSYMCVATNQFNTSQVFTANSSDVLITVKELVSDVKISFTVMKEATQNYSALVNCQALRGTPPITFRLLKETHLISSDTVDDMKATFRIPVVLDRHLGWFRCQADNGAQVASSLLLPIEVVAASGPVTLHYDTDTGENYVVIGLRLYCKAAKGSQPRYRWFLNSTRLPESGAFYQMVHQPPERSVLLLSVNSKSAGVYHCEVSDIFDNSTTFSSRRIPINKDALNRLPTSVMAVVFGSFAVVVLMVVICCSVGVAFRRKKENKNNASSVIKPRGSIILLSYVRWGLESERMGPACEDELDVPGYCEDTAVVTAARAVDFEEAISDEKNCSV
ncbi:Fc receptor-like protein 3 [Synchiropus splendidus]|uniref:Fc receptor-like protein 3 n=1 Tax=Synchiropus splendidus TaxID=270530 RepID=UPI00237DD122|nr:Fc receptor-like protein 3 [Synchiropus splendidus]